MLRPNDLSERCVCGGSIVDPNDDCERCRLVGEVRRLRAVVESLDAVRQGVADTLTDPRLNQQSRSVLKRVIHWMERFTADRLAHK